MKLRGLLPIFLLIAVLSFFYFVSNQKMTSYSALDIFLGSAPDGDGDIQLDADDPPFNLFDEVLANNPAVNYKFEHTRLPGPGADYIARVQADTAYANSVINTANNFNPSSYNFAQVKLLLIAYELVKNSNPSQAQTYKNNLVNVAMTISGGELGENLYTSAWLYDWLYNDLDATTQQNLRGRVRTLLDNWRYQHEIGIQANIFNSILYNRLRAAYIVGAIAIYPDDPQSASYFQYAGNLLYNDFLPTWRLTFSGGNMWEGLDYQDRDISMPYIALDAVSSAFNTDMFAQESYFEDILYWPIYTVLPNGNFLARADTSRHSLYSWGYFPPYLSFAVKYNNPYAFWLYRNAIWGRGASAPSGADGPLEPPIFPWGDMWPTVSPAEANINTLPLHRYFSGVKTVTMRSDWTEDAVHAEFRIDPGYWSHSGLDSGQFSIYRRGSLAVDSGSYAFDSRSGHAMQYFYTALAHNVMLFRDPADTSSSYTRPMIFFPGTNAVDTPLLNDGGFKRYRSDYAVPAPYDAEARSLRANEFDFGDINKLDMQQDYVYAKADLKKAYEPVYLGVANPPSYANGATERTHRLNSYERVFLYLRPDVFIVLDRFDLASNTMEPIWQLHSINEPTIQGNEVTISRTENVLCWGAIWNCRWSSVLQYANNGPTNEVDKYYQYDGKLKMTNLLPGLVNAQIVKDGGFNREYVDLDGVNHAGCEGGGGAASVVCNLNDPNNLIHPNPNRGFVEPGAWRIFLRHQNGPAQNVFLNVLQAGTSQSNFASASSLNVISGDAVGTEVITENQARWAVVLGRNGLLGSQLTYQLSAGQISNLVSDLMPNQAYQVTVRNMISGAVVSQQNYNSNREGILKFDLVLTGNSDITISGCTLNCPPAAPTGLSANLI